MSNKTGIACNFVINSILSSFEHRSIVTVIKNGHVKKTATLVFQTKNVAIFAVILLCNFYENLVVAYVPGSFRSDLPGTYRSYSSWNRKRLLWQRMPCRHLEHAIRQDKTQTKPHSIIKFQKAMLPYTVQPQLNKNLNDFVSYTRCVFMVYGYAHLSHEHSTSNEIRVSRLG